MTFEAEMIIGFNVEEERKKIQDLVSGRFYTKHLAISISEAAGE